jgi:hypothetical protein
MNSLAVNLVYLSIILAKYRFGVDFPNPPKSSEKANLAWVWKSCLHKSLCIVISCRGAAKKRPKNFSDCRPMIGNIIFTRG